MNEIPHPEPSPNQGPSSSRSRATSLSRRRRTYFRVVLAACTYLALELIAFAALTLELGSISSIRTEQKLIGKRVLSETGQRESLDILHPYLGFVRRPQADNERLPIADRATEFGFADDGPPIHHRAPDKIIVGIVGGSVAEQFARQGLETLIGELKRAPQFADKEFVPVRLALQGYKQPQQLMVLNYLLSLGAEFDVLINIDGFNEVALPVVENVPNHVFLNFPRCWHLRITESSDPAILRLMGRVTLRKEARADWAKVFAESPLHHSCLANLIWSVRDRLIRREIIRDVESLSQMSSQQLNYCMTGPRQNFADLSDIVEDAALVWQRSSLQLHRLCAATGIRYYHFLQPNQYVPDSKSMESAERQIAYRAEEPHRMAVEKGYPCLQREGAELAQRGVPFFDLTGLFRDEREPTYRDTCCHYNEFGDELLGRKIGNTIVEHLAAAARGDPVGTSGAASKAHSN